MGCEEEKADRDKAEGEQADGDQTKEENAKLDKVEGPKGAEEEKQAIKEVSKAAHSRWALEDVDGYLIRQAGAAFAEFETEELARKCAHKLDGCFVPARGIEAIGETIEETPEKSQQEARRMTAKQLTYDEMQALERELKARL